MIFIKKSRQNNCYFLINSYHTVAPLGYKDVTGFIMKFFYFTRLPTGRTYGAQRNLLLFTSTNRTHLRRSTD